MHENQKPRKKASQSRAKFTVESILEATTLLLKDRGLKGVTTNKIVEKAGVSIGSLYQYFPNKDAIMAVVVEKVFRGQVEDFLETLSDVSPETHSLKEAIDYVLHEIFKKDRKTSNFNREMIFSALTLKDFRFTLENDELVKEHLKSFFELYKEEIKEEVDLDLFIFMVHYSLKGLRFGLSYTKREDDSEAVAQNLSDMLYRFIAK